MSARLFTMQADYEGMPYPQAIYGTSETILRMIGRDHHRAAVIKPVLTLTSPDGATITTMDEWASDWTEAAAPIAPAAVPSITIAELSAILAGLRLLQSTPQVSPSINAILTNSGGTEPLSLDQMDALCERLNIEGAGA